MYKLTYIIPLNLPQKQFELVTVTHPQKSAIQDLHAALTHFGYKARMWNKDNTIMH